MEKRGNYHSGHSSHFQTRPPTHVFLWGRPYLEQILEPWLAWILGGFVMGVAGVHLPHKSILPQSSFVIKVCQALSVSGSCLPTPVPGTAAGCGQGWKLWVRTKYCFLSSWLSSCNCGMRWAMAYCCLNRVAHSLVAEEWHLCAVQRVSQYALSQSVARCRAYLELSRSEQLCLYCSRSPLVEGYCKWSLFVSALQHSALHLGLRRRGGKISKIFSLCPSGFLSCVFCTAVPTVRCTAMLIALTLWLSECGWQQ